MKKLWKALDFQPSEAVLDLHCKLVRAICEASILYTEISQTRLEQAGFYRSEEMLTDQVGNSAINLMSSLY